MLINNYGFLDRFWYVGEYYEFRDEILCIGYVFFFLLVGNVNVDNLLVVLVGIINYNGDNGG